MRISPKELNEFPRFAFAEEGMFVVDSLCFFTGNDLSRLCDILNSEFGMYYFFSNVAALDNGGFQMRQQYIENIPIPKILKMQKISTLDNDNIYKLYELNEIEIRFIKEYIHNYKLLITTNR